MGVPISNVTRRVVLAASGTGPYNFTFEILAASDIAVYRDDTLLTLTTNYTVTINANGTGFVTLTAAPTGATQIAIVGNRTIQRTTDFVTGGDFFANTVNDEMDQQTIFAQQNAEGLARALQAPQTDPTNINMTLPRAADRAGKYLAFDANGNPQPGDTAVEVSAVYAIRNDITAVAAIDTDVTAVAGNTANVTTVAGSIANVNLVGPNIANVNIVGSSFVTPGAPILSLTFVNELLKVYLGKPSAVTGFVTWITTSVSGRIRGDITNNGSIDLADVLAAQKNYLQKSQTAAYTTYINSTLIPALQAQAAIDAAFAVFYQSSYSSEISAVADIDPQIQIVADSNVAVSAVGNNINSVVNVDSNSANINTVAGISSNVSTVAGISANVTTVAGISGNVTSVAGNSANINTVATNIANVNATGGSIANVNTVAGSIAAVNTNASNIVAIQNASANATSAANSASAAAASAASAAASFDAFDDIYLGAKASDPSVDNDGNALTTGDQYFNTTANELRVYNGSTWQAASTVGGTVTSLNVTGATTLGQNPTLSGGTANGVTYLNGSKVLTSGSALTFDGATLATTGQVLAGYGSSVANVIARSNVANGGAGFSQFLFGNTTGDTRGYLSYSHAAEALSFGTSSAEQMRLTSTGLGIGTSSPTNALSFGGNAARTIWMERHTTANTAGNNLTVQSGGATSGATDKNGGTLALSSGTATGSGASVITFSTATAGAAGTADRAASEKMRLDGAGNLGIGTSTPSSAAKLHIFPASGNALQYMNAVSGSTAGIEIAANGNAAGSTSLFVGQGGGGEGYLFQRANQVLIFGTNNLERMRLDASGNLGLGVTPSAWTIRAFQIASANGPFLAGQSTQALLGTNAFFDGAWKYGGTGLATYYQQSAGVHSWLTAPSGTAGNAITFTQAMTLDASGDLGIGTTSPVDLLSLKKGNAGINLDGAGTASSKVWIDFAVPNNGGVSTSSNFAGRIYAVSSGVTNFSDNSIRIAVPVGGSATPVDTLIVQGGNLGLGVTPSAWRSGDRVLDIGSTASLVDAQSANTRLYNNTFVATGGINTYKITAAASYYDQGGGLHRWFNAPSGTAGNTITFTQAMTLNASGDLGIGTTSPGERLGVMSALTGTTAGSNVVARFQTNGNGYDAHIAMGDNVNASTRLGYLSGNMYFWTNAAERMRIDLSGNLQMRTGAVVVYQPAPAAINTTATLTNANIQAQIINTTGTSYTVTMPLGTTLETLVTWATTDLAYDFTVINTASGTITMAVNTGVTSLGALTIATNESAQFRIRRTAANTFVLYRLS